MRKWIDMDFEMEKQRFPPDYALGLTDKEVRARNAQGLVNVLPNRITKTTRQILRDNIFTLFNLYNFIIGLALFAIGAYSNMVYLAIVMTNIAIGIIQELNAKRLVEKLSLIGQVKAHVVRDGEERCVPVDELVLDDVTLLTAGDQVCADSTVLHGEAEVNESLLTGESEPIIKSQGDSLLSGSFIVSGKCYAQVEHVGEENYAAKLAQEAKKHKKQNSELLNAMRRITRITGYFIVPIATLMFLEAFVLRADSISLSIIATSAALLGMLPKGMVLLISTALVIGIIKLARKKILVQGLHAIETLARVDVLCLDKTGTITEGKMSVSDIIPLEQSAMPVSVQQALGLFVGASEDNNATFAALKEHAEPEQSYSVLSKIPFSSERKWSAVAFETLGTLALGAPEKIVSDHSVSDHSVSLPREITDAQNAGKRILLLGFSKDLITESTLPQMTPVAAVILHDPIRKDAKKTLDFFKQEGVAVKVISGDNPVTVSQVAKQAGFADHPAYLDMTEITAEEEIFKAAQTCSIFGRVTPHQKKILIQAFQSKGHTVAMTGDGVNDVLALKEADCGIAMATGSDAAKQVSQLVLVNSDFTALPDAVMEGRRVVHNATRFGGVFLIKTLYTVLLALFFIIINAPFPFIPLQITLYDLFIEAFPSFALMMEPNRSRLRHAFLPTVLKNALPFALFILFQVIATTVFAPRFGLTNDAAVTCMFFATGIAGALALLKACLPLNKLRILIYILATGGFFVSALLFGGILHLEMPATAALLPVGIAACVAGCLAVAAAILIHYSKRKQERNA
ncbi:MAG: HAD-IC family P-type ATPase [Clostridiales bacterium]|nr:HAD-IC family P-type ATPase [Clostridiales bacterium]